MENANLNKSGLPLFLLLISSFLISDDLKIADEFKDGDVVSADTFNQIFDTIERINRKITPEDIQGTWRCNSVYLSYSSSFPADWQNIEDIASELTGSQINFQATLIGTKLGPAGSITTSSPAPLFIELGNTSFNGTWILRNNNLFIKSQSNNKRVLSIEFVSPSRFIINDREYSVTCDLAAAVPSIPLDARAINSSGEISLTWQDSSNNEDGFKIYRKISSDSEYTLLATQSTVGYLDTSAENGIAYNYYIVSYNANGESAKSKILLITSDSVSPFISLVSPASGSTLSQSSDFQDQGFSSTITLTFSELVTFFSRDRSAFWPMTLYVNDVEINTENAWAPIPLVPDPIHNTFSFGMVFNGYGDYKIIVHKDGIVDKYGNQMLEDLTINFNVTQN